MIRLPLLSLCALAPLAALCAGCDGERGVRITTTTTTTRGEEKGVLKVVDALQCPDALGVLTRKGTARSDGTVCVYAGPRGAEVSLHLTSLGDTTADQALERFRTQLLNTMPRTVDPPASPVTDPDPESATPSGGEAVSITGPGMRIESQGERASVRLPGISIDADGDRANVRIGGFTIRTADRRDGSEAQAPRDMVSIQAGEDGAEIHTRAPGEATRETYILTGDRPSLEGWRLVGYEARGPRGGPIVVAVVRAKDRSGDSVFGDARTLVALNVGD